jgi:hypothetical protein
MISCHPTNKNWKKHCTNLPSPSGLGGPKQPPPDLRPGEQKTIVGTSLGGTKLPSHRDWEPLTSIEKTQGGPKRPLSLRSSNQLLCSFNLQHQKLSVGYSQFIVRLFKIY